MMVPSTRILLLMVTALMVATAATAATAFAEGQPRKKRIIPDMEQVADPIEQTSQANLRARTKRPAPNSTPPLTPGPDLPPIIN
jgi:hypothetical protein